MALEEEGDPVPPDLEGANLQSSERLTRHSDGLRVRQHRGIVPCDIEVTLIELAIPPSIHHWLISAIHLPNVQPLDVANGVKR